MIDAIISLEAIRAHEGVDPMKARESRKPLTIPAQIRCRGRHVNVTVRNVSSQGMMLSGPSLPPPGSDIEVIRGSLALAARVVWSAADLCGVRTQTRIDDALLKRGFVNRLEPVRANPPDPDSPVTILSLQQTREQKSAALLGMLKHLHVRLVDAISALEALLWKEEADRQTFAEIRLRLTQASGERLKFIETSIYPHLERFVPDGNRPILEQLRSEGLGLRATSTKHVATWSLDRIVENRGGYSQAATEILRAMRARVETEKRILYTLLQAGSPESTRGSAVSFETYRTAC